MERAIVATLELTQTEALLMIELFSLMRSRLQGCNKEGTLASNVIEILHQSELRLREQCK